MDRSVREARQYAFGPFVLDPVRRVLTWGAEPLALSATQFDMLLYLVEHASRIVTKEELLDAIWPQKVVLESNVSQTIFTLRKILAVAGAGQAFIATAPGRGYRFAHPVQVRDHRLDVRDADPGLLGAVAADIDAVIDSGRRLRLRRESLAIRAAAMGVILLILAGVGGGLWFWRAQPSPRARSLIVTTPFMNLTGDPAFDRSLDKALEIALDQSPFVNVLPDGQVQETLDLMTRPKNTPLTPALAAEICARNNGDAVVSGSIAALGRRYLLTLNATNCAGDQSLGSSKAEVEGREAVAPALDDLVRRIRGKLGESNRSIDQSDVLAREKTASLDALKLYSQGDWLARHGLRIESLAMLQNAIKIDPNFTMAYLALSEVYDSLHECDPSAETMAKAYALRDTVGERQRLHIEARYAEIVTSDMQDAIRGYRAWTEAFPTDSNAWASLANAQDWIGDATAAVEAGRRAVSLGPRSEWPYAVLGRALMHSGHADAALGVAQQAVRAGLAGEDTQGLLLEIAATRGDQAGVDRALAWARGKPAERYLASLAARYAFRNGQIGRGQALYDRAVDLTHDLGLTDFANSLRARQLADLGETALARQILKATREAADDPDYVFVSAELADPQKAESLMSAYQHDYPHDTLEDSLFAPETRAAIALRKGQPEAAAQALQPVSRYELRGYDTPYLRGRIALAAGDGARAAVEFQKILAHSGVEPTSPLLALAQLGLARAERLRGDHAASRQAYQRFIEEWKAADPDEPLLIAAKAELAAEIIG